MSSNSNYCLTYFAIISYNLEVVIISDGLSSNLDKAKLGTKLLGD